MANRKAKLAAQGHGAENMGRRPGETALAWQSRLNRFKDREAQRQRPLVNPFTAQHGEYVDDFPHHHESETKAKTQRNTVSNIVDKWFLEGGIGFEAGAKQAVEYCIFLWHRAGTQGRLTSNYGERIPGGAKGMSQEEAIDELAFVKKSFPHAYWDVFENVVRWGQPAGTAGSELATNTAQSIAAAKAVVGFIASHLAMQLGY